MKNSFKLGVLGLALSICAVACDPTKPKSTSETTKIDSSKTTTVAVDSTKKDSTGTPVPTKDSVVTEKAKTTTAKKTN